MQGLVDYSDSDDSDDSDSKHSPVSNSFRENPVDGIGEARRGQVFKAPSSGASSKKLNISLLPRSIQLALTRGDAGLDSDSDDDIGVQAKATTPSEAVSSSTLPKHKFDDIQAPSSSSLLSSLPTPLAVASDDGEGTSKSCSSRKWTLPTSSASWSTSVKRVSAKDVYTPHTQGDLQEGPGPVKMSSASKMEDEEEDEEDFVGSGGGGAMFTFAAPLVPQRKNHSEKELFLPAPLDDTGVALSETSSMDVIFQDQNVQLTTDSSSSSSSSSNSSSNSSNSSSGGDSGANAPVRNRKRQREIEQQLQSGNMDALQGQGVHVTEAQSAGPWDSRDYSRKREQHLAVRQKYSADAARLSHLTSGVKQIHKRKNQITSLAASAVEARIKQVES